VEQFGTIRQPFVVDVGHAAPHSGSIRHILINATLRDLQKALVFKRFSHFSRTPNVAFSRYFALARAVGWPSLARTCA
jgi:hypothetical protein